MNVLRLRGRQVVSRVWLHLSLLLCVGGAFGLVGYKMLETHEMELIRQRVHACVRACACVHVHSRVCQLQLRWEGVLKVRGLFGEVVNSYFLCKSRARTCLERPSHLEGGLCHQAHKTPVQVQVCRGRK